MPRKYEWNHDEYHWEVVPSVFYLEVDWPDIPTWMLDINGHYKNTRTSGAEMEGYPSNNIMYGHNPVW